MLVGVYAFSGIFPDRYGGPQESAYHLVRQMALSCDDLRFLVCYRQYSPSSAQPILLPTNKVSLGAFRVPPGTEYRLPLSALRATRQLKRCDLVFLNSPPVWVEPLLLRRPGRPVVFDFHGGLFAEDLYQGKPVFRLGARVSRLLFRWTSRYLDAAIAHSRYMADIAKRLGIPEEKIAILPLGLDMSQFQRAEVSELAGRPSVLFVGRLELIKGCHVLVEAASRLRVRFPDLHLHVVGEGPQKAALDQQIKALGMEKAVSFYSRLPRERLVSMYKSADICVSPSTYNEGFGMSVIEGMAGSGVVIASATGGMKERIEHGVDGLLARPNDVEDLTQCLERLMSEPRLCDKLRVKARKKVQQHDWSVIAPMYADLFRRLASEGASATALRHANRA